MSIDTFNLISFLIILSMLIMVIISNTRGEQIEQKKRLRAYIPAFILNEEFESCLGTIDKELLEEVFSLCSQKEIEKIFSILKYLKEVEKVSFLEKLLEKKLKEKINKLIKEFDD